MNSKKILLIRLSIFIFILFMVNSGFSQIRKEEIIFFSGTITRISNDYKFIVINKMNILITSDTKIVNEKGKILKINDLKPELFVRIEGVQNLNGFLAKKIVVKKPPEV